MAAPTRSRPESSFVANGYCSLFVEVLDRDEAAQPAGLVDERQLLDLVPREQCHRIVGGDADRARDERHPRHDLADAAASMSDSKRMSRLVTIPTSRCSPSTTGSPEMR